MEAFNKDMPEVAAAFARPTIAELGAAGFLLSSDSHVLKNVPGCVGSGVVGGFGLHICRPAAAPVAQGAATG
jgi:hypothetical protein